MIDERFRTMFALLWSDQPGERYNACDALVAHARRLKIHPLDVFSRQSRREDTERLQVEIRSLKATCDRLSAESATLKQKLSAARTAVDSAEAKLGTTTGENTKLRTDLSRAAAALEAKQQELSRCAQASTGWERKFQKANSEARQLRNELSWKDGLIGELQHGLTSATASALVLQDELLDARQVCRQLQSELVRRTPSQCL